MLQPKPVQFRAAPAAVPSFMESAMQHTLPAQSPVGIVPKLVATFAQPSFHSLQAPSAMTEQNRK